MNFSVEPIGFLKTPFPEKFGIPRQPGLAPNARGELVLEPEFNREGVFDGLSEASHVWLIFLFHLQQGQWKPKVRPPRAGGNIKRGVFATRSPNRPNRIGLSVVELHSVDTDKNRLRLANIDLVDGTPILDVKPYVPYADCLTHASYGFAHLAPKELSVEWEPELLELVPGEVRNLATDVLRWDPRPAYQKDDREYGSSFENWNLRWSVEEDILRVRSAEPIVKLGPNSP